MQSSALFFSTRLRLVLWNVGIAGAIMVIFALTAYFGAARLIDGELDRQLDSRAKDVQMHLAHDLSIGQVDSHDLGSDLSGAVLVVLSTDGRVQYTSSNEEVESLPYLGALHAALTTSQPDKCIISVTSDETGEMRVCTEPVIGQGGTVLAVMQLGLWMQPYDHALHELLLVLALVGAGGLVLALGSGFFLASRAMAPVRIAFRRQRDFVADASHELRTPLMLVRADVDVLSRELRSARARLLASSPAPLLSGAPVHAAEAPESGQARETLAQLDDQLELVGDALSEIDRMSRLLGDLLLLARMDAGAVAQTQEPVMLDELLSDLVAQVRRKAEEQGLHVDTHVGSGACVAGNADQMRRLFLILLDNAMRYNQPDGSITLTSAIAGHRARVTVADTGIGIAPADLPHIFERFYRADVAHSRQSGPLQASVESAASSASDGAGAGAGLGLAIAREIIQAHHGQIEVKSAPGRGTAFILSLPLAPGWHPPSQ
jgi:signal transduction histidine kinase